MCFTIREHGKDLPTTAAVTDDKCENKPACGIAEHNIIKIEDCFKL